MFAQVRLHAVSSRQQGDRDLPCTLQLLHLVKACQKHATPHKLRDQTW